MCTSIALNRICSCLKELPFSVACVMLIAVQGRDSVGDPVPCSTHIDEDNYRF